MRIARTILVIFVGLSVAVLPAAVGFAARAADGVCGVHARL